MPSHHALPRGARAPGAARAAALLSAAALLAAGGLAACGTATPPAQPAAASAPDACLPGERGYLKARLKGEIDTELAWQGGALACEGGARPEGRGLRASFLGHDARTGRTLRFVFGLGARPGVAASRNVPAHVTVIAEGAERAWATQGDSQCMVESLAQQRLPVAGAGGARQTGGNEAGASLWRIAARGYCIDPAVTLDGSGRLYVDRFDFAGLARFEDAELATAGYNPPAQPLLR